MLKLSPKCITEHSEQLGIVDDLLHRQPSKKDWGVRPVVGTISYSSACPVICTLPTAKALPCGWVPPLPQGRRCCARTMLPNWPARRQTRRRGRQPPRRCWTCASRPRRRQVRCLAGEDGERWGRARPHFPPDGLIWAEMYASVNAVT